MKLHIPNSAFLGNIESFTNHLDASDATQLHVTSNQKWISVHPLVISMTVALAEEIRLTGGEIKCKEFNAKSRSYLLRMGLIDALNPNHGIQIDERESSGRFIPARKILSSEQLNQFIIDMVPLLHTTPEQAFPIKYVMSELVRNALEHSQSSIGAIVSAQYFKKTNRISIGVADRGIGIRGGMNKSYSLGTDREAISMALRPGITGTTTKIGGTEYNAGAGLFFTKSIAKISRDFFLLYSGNSFFKLHKTHPEKQVELFDKPELDRANFKTSGLPVWKGTAVGIDISMNVNQDFQNLLELIRKAYQLNVQRTNKEKYRRPKFL